MAKVFYFQHVLGSVYFVYWEYTGKKPKQNETCTLDAFGVLDWKEYGKNAWNDLLVRVC